MADRKPRVPFVCTHNTARSQMAEVQRTLRTVRDQIDHRVRVWLDTLEDV